MSAGQVSVMINVKKNRSDRSDKGMTVLEVTIAIILLLISVTYIMRSNFFAYRYTAQIDVQQQLAFYAQGKLEAALIDPSQSFVDSIVDTSPPYNTFSLVPPPDGRTSYDLPVSDNQHLQKIEITAQSSLENIEPVTLITYRLIP